MLHFGVVMKIRIHLGKWDPASPPMDWVSGTLAWMAYVAGPTNCARCWPSAEVADFCVISQRSVNKLHTVEIWNPTVS